MLLTYYSGQDLLDCIGNTYLFASTENAQAKVLVCKFVTRQTILFPLFSHTLGSSVLLSACQYLLSISLDTSPKPP